MQKNPRFCRTLIVDDSEKECQLLQAQLRLLTVAQMVRCVRDGFEALAYLRGDREFGDRLRFPYPDLMLLDLNMPRASGLEVLDQLRYEPRRPRVVLWSTALSQRDQAAALGLGADMACPKPVGLYELSGVLRRLGESVFAEEACALLHNVPQATSPLCALNVAL